MDDLIRRSDVLDMAAKGYLVSNANFGSVRRFISQIPAVDAVEVRHGHWVTEEEAIEKDDYSLRDTCSVCGHCDWDCTESENFNYCPNCGAQMDVPDKDVGKMGGAEDG